MMSGSEKIYIPKNAETIINIFNNSGYEAYLVGGYVRDCLLKKDTND